MNTRYEINTAVMAFSCLLLAVFGSNFIIRWMWLWMVSDEPITRLVSMIIGWVLGVGLTTALGAYKSNFQPVKLYAAKLGVILLVVYAVTILLCGFLFSF